MYDEAVSLIEEHQLAGRDVVIVSTRGAEVVEPIGEMLGADHVIATRMEIEDGKYTGEHRVLRVRRGEGRARSASWPRSAATTSSRCYAYSDSVTDVRCSRPSATPTRSTPTRSCAGSPAPAGWPVLVFTKPVALRARVPLPPAKPDPGGARGRWQRWRSAAYLWANARGAGNDPA